MLFLRGVEKNISFNIYRFGSSFEIMFNESSPYTEENLNDALWYIKKIGADLGGTEIFNPLEAIMRDKVDKRKERKIVVITDGEVGNEEQILKLVKSNNDRTKIFSVGIGYGPNEYFINEIARSGGGTSLMISPKERIEAKILSLFKKIISTPVENPIVMWGIDADQTPSFPNVFPNEVTTIFAKSDDSRDFPEIITIKGSILDKEQEWSISLLNIEDGGEQIPLLWAREMIRECEELSTDSPRKDSLQKARKEKKVKEKIIDISREFGILCRSTSFIAVESRSEDEKMRGEAVLRKIPVLITNGWHGIEQMGINNSIPSPLDCRIEGFFERDSFISDNISPYQSQRSFRKNKTVREGIHYFETSIRAMQDVLPYNQPSANSKNKSYNFLLNNILSKQLPLGGFKIDGDIAKYIGTTLQQLKKTAARIESDLQVDEFLLLSTAITLKLLEEKFNDMKDVWSGVVGKSEKWLRSEVKRTNPKIDGIELKKWAGDFLNKQESLTL